MTIYKVEYRTTANFAHTWRGSAADETTARLVAEVAANKHWNTDYHYDYVVQITPDENPDDVSERITKQMYEVEYRTMDGRCHRWSGEAENESNADVRALRNSFESMCNDDHYHSMVSVYPYTEEVES